MNSLDKQYILTLANPISKAAPACFGIQMNSVMCVVNCNNLDTQDMHISYDKLTCRAAPATAPPRTLLNVDTMLGGRGGITDDAACVMNGRRIILLDSTIKDLILCGCDILCCRAPPLL